MVSSLEKGVKISHPVFYHADYMKMSPAVACLYTKREKEQILKNNQHF